LNPAVIPDIMSERMSRKAIDRRSFSLLVVDDDPGIRALLESVLAETGYTVHLAETAERALEIASKQRIDAALLDLDLPGMKGLELLGELKRRDADMLVSILTGRGTVENAVEAMKQGAVDFIQKPVTTETLLVRVGQLHEIWRLHRENRSLREEMQFSFGFERLVGNSEPMQSMKKLIVQAGASDASVLIQGETGTGKELVARAIHRHSPRKDKPFVPVDCASISESVLESELFGHVKGAFTGAHVSHIGMIRSAEGGTVFFDEVGELSGNVQAKLLRTIQEREIRPVGSAESHPVDVRVVCATNRDLAREVIEGRFREDLLYRLNVITLQVPPLRDRREDIPLLVDYFLEILNSGHSPLKEVSEETLRLFQTYRWPGNVRELENVIRRALALGRKARLDPQDLPEGIRGIPPPAAESPLIPAPPSTSLKAYELEAIRNALKLSAGNRRRAAQILQIGEATLYRKLKEFGLADH
jgi:DNA-binding NtrC family response regulator